MAVANFRAKVMEQRLVAIIESMIHENTNDPTKRITFGRPEIKPF
jgi:hypothetical protein